MQNFFYTRYKVNPSNYNDSFNCAINLMNLKFKQLPSAVRKGFENAVQLYIDLEKMEFFFTDEMTMLLCEEISEKHFETSIIETDLKHFQS